MKILTLLIVFIVTFCLITAGCNSTTDEETLPPQATDSVSSTTKEPAELQPDDTIITNTKTNEQSTQPTEQVPSQPTREQYQVSIVIHPPGAGIVTTEPPGDLIDAGTEVTFISVPEYEFSFDHWRIDGELSENITPVTLNSNIVVDAYFSPNIEKIPPQVVQDYIDKENEIVLVDVRPFEDFQKDHIPGAISIPSDEIKSRWNEIPPDKITFVYASCMK